MTGWTKTEKGGAGMWIVWREEGRIIKVRVPNCRRSSGRRKRKVEDPNMEGCRNRLRHYTFQEEDF